MSHINPGDTAFVLMCAALVAIMTPGLAFFYGGLVRHKNVITIMMQSFASLGVVTLIWVTVGFTLAFGHRPWRHHRRPRLPLPQPRRPAAQPRVRPTIPFLAFFIFQLTVAALTPALITGAFADRIPFGSYLVFLAAWSLLVYVPLAHWIWGGGFLQQWGVVDFGGGMVVHAAAGFSALASIYVVKKRVFAPGEEERPSNIPLIAIGLGPPVVRLARRQPRQRPARRRRRRAGLRQHLHRRRLRHGRLDVHRLGAHRQGQHDRLAHRRARRPRGRHAVRRLRAHLGGRLHQPRRRLDLLRRRALPQAQGEWDDSLDVWGVHGIGGLFGSLMVGWFAYGSVNGVSGLMDGNPKQFGLQLAAVAITVSYTFVVTFVIFKVIDLVGSLHAPARTCRCSGLDEEFHGETAYDLA